MPRRWIDRTLGLPRARSGVFSRRRLLQAGLAAAAGLLSTERIGALASQPAAKRRVVIVGAGFAGLACAYELTSIGYDVRVFEARQRVGGRVLSLKELIPGKNVEGGGELLGSNHPHVLAYAAKFGFEFLDVSDDGVAPPPTMLDGRKLRSDEVEWISAEIDAALVKLTDDASPVVADEPWQTPNADRLDRLTTAEWIQGLNMSPLAKHLLTVQLTTDNGVDTSKQSYLGNLAQVKGGGLEKYWTDTEVFRLKGGNQQFALRFAQELGDERLTLNCPIREITATDKGVTVVDVEDRTHTADDVVLAIPPSVWSMIKFSPALPKVLDPQMGMSVKFLAVAKSRFWREAKLPPNACSDGNVGETWGATEGQGDEGSAAMSVLTGGPVAEAIHRRAVPERQPAYLKELEILFPGFGSQFVKGQMMDWIGDPWTRAGYSFPAPGQVTTVGPMLREGIGRLHFAGEHTCYQFVGYMEGALHSGVALAKFLAARDGVAPKL